MSPRLLQLLPAHLAHETRALVRAAAHAAHTLSAEVTESHPVSQTLHRPLWETVGLLSSDYHRAGAVHAIGPAVRACSFSRVPVIYTPDLTSAPRPPSDLPFYRVYPAPPSLTDLAFLRLIARRVPVYAVTSSLALTQTLQLIAVPFKHVYTVPPTHNLPPLRPARDEALRARLGFSPTDHVVLACGDSTLSTNHILALWAVSILGFSRSNWKLLLTGTGPSIPRLEKFSRDAGPNQLAVFAPDYLPAPSFPDLLPAADVVLDTSLPNRPIDSRPLLEALAAGLPLLATPSRSARAALPPSLLIPNPTPKIVARKLLDLLEPPPDSNALTPNLLAVQTARNPLFSHNPTHLWRDILASI